MAVGKVRKAVEVMVVVDVQQAYPAARDAALIAAIEERAARVVAGGGVVLEVLYDGSGPSMLELPPECGRLWKPEDNGGAECAAWLAGREVVPAVVRVVGVNLSVCVYHTAVDLAGRVRSHFGPNVAVEIIADLCGDNCASNLRIVPTWPSPESG